MPRTAWMVRYTRGVTSDGRTVSCGIESTGVQGLPSECFVSGRANGATGTETSAAGYAITETYFFPIEPDSAPATPEIQGADKVAKQISRVTITPDGQVIACNGVLYSGESSPKQDACNFGEQPRFEAAPESFGPLFGTLVHVAYIRLAATATEAADNGASPKR